MTTEEVVGEEVSAVSFVMDYFEIHLNGPVIRVLSAYELREAKRSSSKGSPGWRDHLCALIGRQVRSQRVEEAKSAVFEFAGDITLRVDLNPNQGECMHFMPGVGQRMEVW